MKQRVLLLQGPVGGFFKYLQSYLRDAGFEVRRVVFNGGDILFALGSDFEIARAESGDFGEFFDRMFHDWRPDAIVLLGDERPIHRAARKRAESAGIPVWSFEEGYVRPDHITFEPGGNNANSRLRATFDPSAAAPVAPPAPHLRGQTVAMGLRAWAYFVAHRSTRPLFPGYTHHRERRLRDEFRFWIRSAYRRVMAQRHDRALVKEILSGLHPPFFIVALQVHDDLQLRCHGRGWKNMTFTEMVLESFRRAAPPEARLVIKAHPLDVGHGHHRKNIRLLIRKHGLEDRVEYLQSGPLLPIVRHAKGLVTVNSTAGIAALRNQIPTLAFGDALYHIDGLTKRPERPEDLDRFWNAPPPVDLDLAWRFGAHTMASVLLPGSFYLGSTWPKLCEDVTARLKAALSPSEPEPAVRDDVATVATLAADDDDEREAAHAGRRIGICSSGVWRHRAAVATLLGGQAVRLRGPWSGDCDEVVGWGFKPTSRRARALAKRHRLPYVALEDGFLRSVRPGPREAAIGWVVDRTGIYYDSHGPSDLERAIVRRAREPVESLERAEAVLRAIRELRLSKYNHAPMLGAEALGLPRGRDVVVVIDQTLGDVSVSGSGSDGATFVRMIDAAIAENPGLTIAVKIHPEAISGVKKGYLAEVARHRPVVLVTTDVNPWALIEIARRVYVVSSQFGMEAALAGVPVTCFGAGAHAGWGLTDDRIVPIHRRNAVATPQALAAAAYLDYSRWIDPWDGREIDVLSAIDRLAFLRDRFHENTTSVCVGFTPWKRAAARQFLGGIGGEPTFVATAPQAEAEAVRRSARIVAWGRRAFDTERPAAATLVRAEDGFLRSVGLGAAFVAPASLVFDDEGIYYDPRQPSRFETLARTTAFDAALVARAARLRQTIVERGLSKYNDADARPLDFPEGRMRVLVPGQVEDDASVQLGSPEVRSNLDLLRRVRARWPEAHVVYKPHPDVQAGFRKGRIAEADLAGLADRVVTDVSMPSLLAQVDRVETMTSLTGFEALLRGLPVTTHGLPFYAGWGLTEDLMTTPRRGRQLGLDELVAVTLILYPRYVDPETGLPCPVEVVVGRLDDHRSRPVTALDRLGRGVRHAFAWSIHNLVLPIGRLFARR